VRLSGVFQANGFKQYCGFLTGTSVNTSFYNIECDFEDGTKMSTGATSTTSTIYIGGMSGSISNVSTSREIVGVTIGGSVDFDRISSNFGGGVVGYCQNAVASLIRNLATFPSGILGENVGGIMGRTYNGSLSKCINAMTGTISGMLNTGGIIGSATDMTIETVVNSMIGNISSAATAGGIIGDVTLNSTPNTFINYMSGDISSSDTALCGGLVGRVSPDESTLTSSINAMNGVVPNAVVGTCVSSILSVTLNTDFGLTFYSENFGTYSPVDGLETSVYFTDLPYVSLGGSDTIGTNYNFDFVYANVGGKISIDNTTAYLAYINADTKEVYVDAALNVVQSEVTTSAFVDPFTFNTRVLNISVDIAAQDGALEYKLTYEGIAGKETTAFSGFTDLKKNITSLQPETEYIVRLYVNRGDGYALRKAIVTSTLANTPTNYIMADFEEAGIFDLTGVSDVESMSVFFDDLFVTGDKVDISVRAGRRLPTTFVNIGGKFG